MNNALACSEPLDIAVAKPCGCTGRVRVIDASFADNRDCLKTPVWM